MPPEQRVAALAITPVSVTLFAIGAHVRLGLRATDAGGQVVSGITARWTSADPSVARVDSTGLVTGVAGGQTTVAAVVGSASATAAVQVTQVPATIQLTWPGDTILRAFGPARAAAAIVADSNGSPIPGASVTWSVSDTGVAAVNAAGLVSARRNGRVLLRAEAGDASATLGLLVDVRGALRVRLATRGPGRPLDGYSLRVDSLTFPLAADTALVVGDLKEGIHPVSIAPGGGLCIALGIDRQGMAIVPADTVEIDFSYRCAGRYSYLAWDDHAAHYVDEFGRDSRITPSYDNIAAFEWSPDGSRAVYAASAPGQPLHLFTVRADGTGVTQLTNGATGEGEPRWSPDGTRILFVVPAQPGPGPTQWYTMAAEGGDVRPLAYFDRIGDGATWSPDGRWVVLDVAGAWFVGVNLIDSRSGAIIQLDSTSGAHAGGFSPDGSRISLRNGITSAGGVGVYHMSDGAVASYPMSAYPSGLAWSPDGTRLLVDLTADRWSVVRLDLADGRVTSLTPADAWYWGAAYLPDGRSILLLASHASASGILLMDDDGTNVQALPHVGGYPTTATYRP